jgi:hypothetical protein
VEIGSAYTLVTVTHRGDEALMHLQARSLDVYLDRGLCNRIVVVDNDPLPRSARRRQELLSTYGGLAGIVQFVDSSELGGLPGWAGGWTTQQALKLLSARVVDTDRYLILDAKNHLVWPLSRDHIETGDGRFLSYWVDYSGHSMREHLAYTLEYFGLPARHVRWFTPTVTPFAVSTEMVQEAIGRVEMAESAPFALAFARPDRHFTEFFLLIAHVLTSGRRLESVYDWSGSPSVTLWPRHAACSHVREALAQSARQESPFFGVHRGAVPRLSPQSQVAIAAFWHRQGLVDGVWAGLSLLEASARHRRRSHVAS